MNGNELTDSSPEIKIIDLTPDNIEKYGVCGYKDITKHVELIKKIEWFNSFFARGLRIKALISKDEQYQGMIEYIPGKFAHRPVEANGYMFIHCIFLGLKKEFKGKGYGLKLLDACIDEAKKEKMDGVAVVTRKGAFMAKRDLFLKRDFIVIDKAKPDFELMVLKFNKQTTDPKFKAMDISRYEDGLTILRSPQCPYTEKNVKAIIESAEKNYKITTNLVDLSNEEEVQMSPCPFGTFCIIYNGEIISYHPISKTRFENIMKTKLK